MLFEEFVPLEYRQQLVETQTTRRRLPSLFSPSNKSKQWKPAATLNGRPYVVGHVPRSPSHKEVEFEGLLRGNASATKVISLRPSQPPSSLSPPNMASERAATPRPIAMNPVSSQQLRQEPVPMSPARPVSSRDSDPPMTPQKRPSRFRLPGGIPVPSPGGGGRKSGMVPAEYSAVDFDTRMAGYSDDEDKPGNRESKDDAWVDILVATHSRRMGGQEAELKKSGDRVRGLRGRSEPHLADPELASMEVAQALAGVRATSPPSDDEIDNRHMEPASGYRDSEYDETHDESVIEPEGYQPEPSQDLEDDPDVDSIMSHPRRRMGYFDLHPERRPARKSEEDEDPRARLTQSHSDDEDDEAAERALEQSRMATLTAHHNDEIDVPEFNNNDEQLRQKESTHSRAESATIPQQVVDPPKRTTSKTAALIEMYREKEREREKPPVSPTGSPAPSKLPVRSASLPQRDPPPPAEAPAGPLPAAPVEPSSPEHQAEHDSDLEEPPHVPLDESGRDSPGRYIHGAPLHNVLEEEEEE